MGSQLFLRLLSIFAAENKIVAASHCYQLRLNQDAQPTFQIKFPDSKLEMLLIDLSYRNFSSKLFHLKLKKRYRYLKYIKNLINL